MTKEELNKLYDEWEKAALASDDNAAGDDYYYHGASAFKTFLEQHLDSSSEPGKESKVQ